MEEQDQNQDQDQDQDRGRASGVPAYPMENKFRS